MRFTQLRSGLRISEIGMGCAQLGNLYRATSDDEARIAVDAAWDAGIRYFDTAPHYGLGLSERRVGEALRGRPRAEYVISTKVGRLLTPSPETADRRDDEGFDVPASSRRVWDFSRDGILRSVEDSLIRLQTDHLDIAYLHDPDDHWEQASTTGIAALIELREQGVVGAVGAGMNQSAMLTEFIRRSDVDILMLAGRYTLLDRSAAQDLLPLAADRGVAIVAAGVYNSGLLSSAQVSDDAMFDYAPAPRELVNSARRMAAACARYGVSLPDAAVQFALRDPAVVSVVLGTRTAAQARSGVERYGTPVPEPLWSELDLIAASGGRSVP